MNTSDTTPRFRGALDRAHADWAAADPAACAQRAGCERSAAGILVPFFGRPHLVTHPEGLVTTLPAAAAAAAADEADMRAAPQPPGGDPAHAAVVIAVLHYLLTADGTPPAGSWLTFRELPDGLFYATAFAARAEEVLVKTFAAPIAASPSQHVVDPGEDAADPRRGIAEFERAAAALGGEPLGLADVSFRFAAFPRVALAVLLWAGDEDEPGQARLLFDAHAGHYLPAEDAAGLGEWLAQRLAHSRPVSPQPGPPPS